jgi:cell division septation protein DedD
VNRATLALAFSLLAASLAAQTADSVIAEAISRKESEKVIAALESGARKLGDPASKRAVLRFLADYEERLALADRAADHYLEAASSGAGSRDEGLVLDAARCRLSLGDAERANALVSSVLLASFDDAVLARARVYAAWISLSSAEDPRPALSQIRSYADQPAFAAYEPALLFTLWWSDSDASARDRLLARHPASPEAAVARGEMGIAPISFWYLMPRDARSIAAFAAKGSAKSTASKSAPVSEPADAKASGDAKAPADAKASGNATVVADATASADALTSGDEHPRPTWHQLGFFRQRDYAEELVAKLRAKGFEPIIRNEKRPSGTVYFAVLVPEDPRGEVGPRLKDAGFESFPLFEK